jgi:ABC-type amino acid transport substrate-binding protein
MRAMKTRRSALLVCLAVLLVVLAVVPAAQGAGVGSPTVIVGTSNDLYAPFEYPIAGGTKSIGFDHDLVLAIAREAGFKVAFRTFAWGYIATYPGPWADCDMVAAAVTPWPPRRAFMRFSDLYFNEDPHGPLAFAFPKTQAGAALCAQVNVALQQVKDDGTWARLYLKWFGVAPATIP